MKEIKIDDVKVEKSETVKVPVNAKKTTQTANEEPTVEQILDDDNFYAYVTPKGREWIASDHVKDYFNSDIYVLLTELEDAKHDRDSAYREIEDLRKTISKMKQQHDAEVQDLKDQLGEAKAETNAVRKHKDEILKKHVEYADALDNDSVAFEEILGMAIILERSAKSMQEMSKMLQEKTEGKV